MVLDASKLTGSVRPQKQAYMISSGVICIIYLLCTFVLFLGVKEQKGKQIQIVPIPSVSLPTILAVLSSVLDCRERAIQGPAYDFPTRPVHGLESRAVHQTSHRLPLHIPGIYGNYSSLILRKFR